MLASTIPKEKVRCVSKATSAPMKGHNDQHALSRKKQCCRSEEVWRLSIATVLATTRSWREELKSLTTSRVRLRNDATSRCSPFQEMVGQGVHNQDRNANGNGFNNGDMASRRYAPSPD
jgi:hypothetical protein